MNELLAKLESEAIAIWEFLTGKPSLPTQLERLYLKPLVYLVAFFVNQQKAIAATAKPGIIGGSAEAYRTRILAISGEIADAGITNPSGNNLVIHLLAISGAPSVTLLNLVQLTMEEDENYMMCDAITVQPALAQNYTISTSISISLNANSEKIKKEVEQLLVVNYKNKQLLGVDIIYTDIVKLIRNLNEVGDVLVSEPATNITIPPQSYANCTAIAVAVGGRMS
jgi:phage-related baseplate assembly protein